MSEDIIEESEIEAELRTDEPEGLLKKIFRATGKGALAVGFVMGLVTVGADYSTLETVTDYAVHASPWACMLYGSASMIYSCKR